MFSQIRTTSKNKEIVSKLTRRLDLGTENVIARIALTYSLSKGAKLDLTLIGNASGKTYAKSVLFGDNMDIYVGLVATHYGLYKTDKDIPKYIKMHIDEGLTLLNRELEDNANIDGFDFLAEKIQAAMVQTS